MSVKSEKIPCTGKKPICVRKKRKSGKTSEYDCNGEILNVGKRLNDTYGLQWNEGKDVEGNKIPEEFGGICGENGEQNDDDCFCNTGDYAWLTYIGEARRRLETLKKSVNEAVNKTLERKNDNISTEISKKEENILKEEIKSIYEDTKESKKMPFDFIALINEIIQIIKLRWPSNDTDNIIRKLDIILGGFKTIMDNFLNETPTIDKEEEPISDTQSSSFELSPENIALLEEKGLKLEEIDELIGNINKTLTKTSIDMVLKVIDIADDIFKIGNYIIQDKLEKSDIEAINDTVTTLSKNIEDILPNDSHIVKGGRKQIRKNTYKGKRKLRVKKNTNKKFLKKNKGKKSKFLRKKKYNTKKQKYGGVGPVHDLVLEFEYECFRELKERERIERKEVDRYRRPKYKEILGAYLYREMNDISYFLEFLFKRRSLFKSSFFMKCLLTIGYTISKSFTIAGVVVSGAAAFTPAFLGAWNVGVWAFSFIPSYFFRKINLLIAYKISPDSSWETRLKMEKANYTCHNDSNISI